MDNRYKETSNKTNGMLWGATFVLSMGLLFARVIYPENLWLTVGLAVPLVGVLGALIQQNRKALQGRTAAYGLNSVVTAVLVIAILGVLNFLASRYPQKLDLTKNKMHTLSDQTEKMVKGLNKTVKATLFSNLQEREQMRPLLDNYKGYSTKFEVEYVDPVKEPTRTRQLGIKASNTLVLSSGDRTQKVEAPNEEKITNAMIKLLKEKSQTLCAITGHGEKSFMQSAQGNYSKAKKALEDQAYTIKEVNIITSGKIPEDCDAIALLGPTKGLFPQEAGFVRDYLANGGRALIAIDPNVKGGELAPELLPILEAWHVKSTTALIVDPISRMFGQDASVLVVPTYSKDHAITKDFQMQSFFPFARPLEVVPGAPAGLNVTWLAQSTPSAWSETNMQELASGRAQMTQGQDKQGPLTVAIAVDGKQKDSKAAKNTRLVVFGSSLVGADDLAERGGNLDFFLNSASWVMEDESLISIRAKEDGPGKVELSQKQGRFIFLLTVIVIPVLIAVAGVVIWTLRRKL